MASCCPLGSHSIHQTLSLILRLLGRLWPAVEQATDASPSETTLRTQAPMAPTSRPQYYDAHLGYAASRNKDISLADGIDPPSHDVALPYLDTEDIYRDLLTAMHLSVQGSPQQVTLAPNPYITAIQHEYYATIQESCRHYVWWDQLHVRQRCEDCSQLYSWLLQCPSCGVKRYTGCMDDLRGYLYNATQRHMREQARRRAEEQGRGYPSHWG